MISPDGTMYLLRRLGSKNLRPWPLPGSHQLLMRLRTRPNKARTIILIPWISTPLFQPMTPPWLCLYHPIPMAKYQIILDILFQNYRVLLWVKMKPSPVRWALCTGPDIILLSIMSVHPFSLYKRRLFSDNLFSVSVTETHIRLKSKNTKTTTRLKNRRERTRLWYQRSANRMCKCLVAWPLIQILCVPAIE